MAWSFAGRLALLAFAATSAAGVGSGAALGDVLTTALIRLTVFYGLGLLSGALAQALMEERAQQEFERLIAAADQPPP